MHRLTVVAGLAWVIVAGYGLLDSALDFGDNWEVPYAVFNVALFVGAVAVLAAVRAATRGSSRSRLRVAGLVVTGVGGAAAFVGAWALPLWMTVLGAGLLTLTFASAPGERRAVGLLAAGQVAGLVVLFAGLIAEVGRQDEYGDYPVPAGIAMMVTAALVIAGLIELSRGAGRPLLAGDRP
jgi:hypothetical protein